MVDGKGKGNDGTGGAAVIVVQLCWNGSQDRGMEWVRAMCAWEGEQSVPAIGRSHNELAN